MDYGRYQKHTSRPYVLMVLILCLKKEQKKWSAQCSFSSCVIIRNSPCRLKTNVLLTEIISIIHNISLARVESFHKAFPFLFSLVSLPSSVTHLLILHLMQCFCKSKGLAMNSLISVSGVKMWGSLTSAHHCCAYCHLKLVCQPATHLSCCFLPRQHHTPYKKSSITACSKVHVPLSQNNHLKFCC